MTFSFNGTLLKPFVFLLGQFQAPFKKKKKKGINFFFLSEHQIPKSSTKYYLYHQIFIVSLVKGRWTLVSANIL